MARIRTIKPEFPHSESVGRLSRDARLLFIQLWTIADDHGRARAAPQLLAGSLYPYDTDALKLLPKWLSELEAEGHIRLYEVDGSRYLDIPSWCKHQRVDNAGKSNIPDFRGEPPRDSASDGEPPLDLGPRTIGPRTNIRAVAEATRPDDFDEFWKSYPKRDGANPKAPARKKFFAAVKSGTDPRAIIAATKRSADEARSKGQIGTPYVPQAITWLNQQRWGDYPPQEPVSAQSTPQPPSPDLPSDEELRRKYGAANGDAAGAAEQHPEPRSGGRQLAGDAREFLEKGPRNDQGDGASATADNQPRHSGIRSLGEILSRTPTMGALVAQGREDREHSGDDGAGAVAGVVRSELCAVDDVDPSLHALIKAGMA